MLVITDINKSYGNLTILEHVSFAVERGQVCAFLGLNGAGKSTLMKIICALAFADSGKVELDGQSLLLGKKHGSDIGYMIETPAFYGELTGKQNLIALAILHDNIPLQRIDEVLALVGLTVQANVAVKKYSLGMKQRLYFAYAIMGNPKLLILDEPFNSIDPVSIDLFKKLITKLAKNGCTVLISGHVISELQSISDCAVIIDNGKIIRTFDDIQGVNLTKVFLSIVSASGDAQ